MITLLFQNMSGGTPTTDELALWADTYGITHPVVADANLGVTSRYTSGTISLPSMHQIGAGAEVLQTQTYLFAGDIEAALPP